MLNYLTHHGIKGQKWGVRRYQNEDGTLILEEKNKKNIGKKIGAGLSGALIGASIVGTAWILKNKHSEKVKKALYSARAKKANETKALRKAAGYYQNFSNVDVVINKGKSFTKSFSNVKLVKIMT